MKYEHLSDFMRGGYVDALFFTETGPDNPEFDDYGFYDFAPETLTWIITDCASFELSNKALLNKALLNKADQASQGGYTSEQAGHDLWLTRNRHGAGFWDRGLHDIGEAPIPKAESMGELSLVLGDDKKLYLE